MKTFRCGIIGSGNIAMYHARDMVKTGKLIPYALCDVNPLSLEQMAEEFGIPEERRFSDYNQLLALREVDAVSICTPNFTHFDICMAAVRAGKPYALEKPAAMTADEAKRLLDATRAARLPNTVCFSYRFLPAVRRAKQLLEQGALGTLHHVYAQYIEGKDDNECLPLLWRYRKEFAGSGSLGDLGSHTIDMVRWLTDCEFESALGTGGVIVKQREKLDGSGMGEVDAEDWFHFIARMQSGVSATFAFTKFAWGRKNAHRVEVYGSKGGLIYTLEKGVDRLRLCLGKEYGLTGDWVNITLPRDMPSQMEVFAQRLCGNEMNVAADIFDGYMAQVMIDELLASDERRTWRDIPRIERA